MVKKIASIFFLGIFLFNWFGYRLLSTFLENEANAALIVELDNEQYNDEELLSIKLPSNLPYYNNSKHFERMDGEIEINGLHYNYVKFRMYNDTVEYLCIPNQAKSKLSNARDEFYKLVNDLQHPTQSNKTGNSGTGIKSMLSEYYQETHAWTFSACLPANTTHHFFCQVNLINITISPRELPPDATYLPKTSEV